MPHPGSRCPNMITSHLFTQIHRYSHLKGILTSFFQFFLNRVYDHKTLFPEFARFSVLMESCWYKWAEKEIWEQSLMQAGG